MTPLANIVLLGIVTFGHSKLGGLRLGDLWTASLCLGSWFVVYR